MKTNYDGFRGWLNYIRDYKDNIDNDLISEQRLIDANKEITKLQKKIEELECLIKEYEHLIQLREIRIEEGNKKISTLMRENKILQENYLIIMRDNEKLEEKIDTIEKRRRANAAAIGQKQRKINKLEKAMAELIENHKYALAKLEHKINFLENSKHAPTKEEVIAYETSMKEVEKRLNGKSNNNQ